VDALKTFYEEQAVTEASSPVLGYAVMMGRRGVPAMVITFVLFYWAIGMTKYYSG
jgi:hypothetical protein